MPGANYMGGKRHALKARAKDAVGRIQKGYFGRQKLDVISNSLATNRAQQRLKQHGAAHEISLAHAKKQTAIDDDSYSYIPSPTRPALRAGRARNYGSSSAHTSSPNPRHSKVLEAIDTTDPVCLRKTLDDILALPDLAYLHSWGSQSRSRKDSRANKSPLRSVHSRPASPIEDEEFMVSGQNSFDYPTLRSPSPNPAIESFHSHVNSNEWGISDAEDDILVQRDDSIDSWEPMVDDVQHFPYFNPTTEDPQLTPVESRFPNRVNFGPGGYGDLFNEDDPWKKVGEILGLPNCLKVLDNSVTPSLTQGSILPGTDEEKETAEWDVLVTRSDADETMTSEYKRPVHEETSYDEIDFFQLSPSPKIDTPTGSQCSSSADPQEDITVDPFSPMEGPDDMHMIVVEPFDSIFDSVVGGRPEKESVTANVVEADSYTAEGGLGLPELKEMNGTYVGPALFEFSESDEE